MYGCFVRGSVRNDLLDFQVVKDAFVKLPFRRSALPELLIVVVKTLPVFAKLSKAVLVYVFDNAPSTSRNLSALLQAVYLTLSGTLTLALHEIIIVRFASCSNEETSR